MWEKSYDIVIKEEQIHFRGFALFYFFVEFTIYSIEMNCLNFDIDSRGQGKHAVFIET